jgi:hypothetical protein
VRRELRVGLPAPELAGRAVAVIPELLGELDDFMTHTATLPSHISHWQEALPFWQNKRGGR